MKKLFVLALFSVLSTAAKADCIDVANGVAAYFNWDVSTVSGLSNWQAVYNICVQNIQ